MSSLATSDNSNLDDLVGTLMSQLKTKPPHWMSNQSNDKTTQEAVEIFRQHAANTTTTATTATTTTTTEKSTTTEVTQTKNQKETYFSEKTKAHWMQVKKTKETEKEWYNKAEDWWSDPNKAPATVDGVLGGFGELDPIDVEESKQFLNDVNTLMGRDTTTMINTRALDGGAGIGRVAKHLLSKFYSKVDLVEGNQRLIDAAPEYMKNGDDGDLSMHLGELYCDTLQDFIPERNGYDCIWVQWVIIYLTDIDLVRFLKRCVVGLKKGGIIVIKENVLSAKNNSVEFVVDEDDSSLTRSKPYMKWIFEQAGLEIFIESKQNNWHRSMLPVMMYSLIPKEESGNYVNVKESKE